MATLIDSVKERLASIGNRLKGSAAQGAACAQFCEQVFPQGQDRTQCVRDAANHLPGNLCDACGADVSRLCSAPDGSRTCCSST
jgi:hypothetical protein